MVAAARETGKLLQIGHQRRSNPRYLHCYEKLLGEAKLLGRIVTVNGQWNRAVAPDLGAPDRYVIPEARLKQYGFKDMHQFRNWRWYKGLGGGPIVDLGSHQIDIYSWFLGANPSARDGQRGAPLLRPEDARVVRHGHGGVRLRDAARPGEGVLPDADDQRQPGVLRELHGRPGDAAHLRVGGELRGEALPRPERARLGHVDPEGLRDGSQAPGGEGPRSDSGAVADVRESVSPDEHTVPVVLRDPYHQPHLQNFFDAVRGKGEAQLRRRAVRGRASGKATSAVRSAVARACNDSPTSRSGTAARAVPPCRARRGSRRLAPPRRSRPPVRGAWTWKTGSSPARR